MNTITNIRNASRDDIDAIVDTIMDDAKLTFTMPDICRALNIDPKIARSRYRNVDNDGVKTRYEFRMDQWDEIAMIISPKRVAKKSAPAINVPVGY